MRTAVTFLGMGGCLSSTMRKSATAGPRFQYGGLPLISSMTVQPSDQMSETGAVTDLEMISGATARGAQ